MLGDCRFFVLEAYETRCCKPREAWQGHCYFIALHRRTLFSNIGNLVAGEAVTREMS
jgi:hypothetical protein